MGAGSAEPREQTGWRYGMLSAEQRNIIEDKTRNAIAKKFPWKSFSNSNYYIDAIPKTQGKVMGRIPVKCAIINDGPVVVESKSGVIRETPDTNT